MKKINCTKIGQSLGVSHSAVSQWFSGKTLPTIDKAFKMEDIYQIPISAWRDIRPFIQTNYSNNDRAKTNTKKIDKDIK